MQKKKKKSKLFFVSEITASEIVDINCFCSEENTCHRQSMGQHIVLRCNIPLREAFSTLIVFKGINKCGEHAVVQIVTVFWPVYHVTCPRFL